MDERSRTMANVSEQFSVTFTEGQPDWEDWLKLNEARGLATAGKAAKALLLERIRLLRAGWEPRDERMLARMEAVCSLNESGLDMFDDFIRNIGSESGRINPGRPVKKRERNNVS